MTLQNQTAAGPRAAVYEFNLSGVATGERRQFGAREAVYRTVKHISGVRRRSKQVTAGSEQRQRDQGYSPARQRPR